jgi:hypothetical protein
LTLESSLRLVEVVRQFDPDDATPETLLTIIEILQERDDDYTPQLKHGESRWPQVAVGRFGHLMTNALRRGAASDREYYARCKRALIVNDWIEGVPIEHIENNYSSNAFVKVGHGDIRGFADGSRYLLESAARITSIVLERPEDEARLAALLRRLDLGIPMNLLPLTEIGIELTRSDLLTLWRANITTPEHVAATSVQDLEQLIGPKAVRLRRLVSPDQVVVGQ